MQVESKGGDSIIFLPDKSLNIQATFTSEDQIEHLFLIQHGSEICELPRNDVDDWNINLKVIHKGKVSILI